MNCGAHKLLCTTVHKLLLQLFNSNKLYQFVLTFRELAYQIADQFRVFGRHIGLKDAIIVGGIGEVHNHLGMPPTAPSLFDSFSGLLSLKCAVLCS